MILNQRVDLVQEQLDVLWQLAQLGCERKTPAVCVTSVPYDNFTKAANLSRELSKMLTGEWDRDFEGTLQKLRASIIHINSTRLETWISSVFNYFKEWVGVGLFAVVAGAGILISLCLICKLKGRYRREKIIMTQALMAVEQGASPQVWLNLLTKQ